MNTFKDNAGREWVVSIDVFHVEKVEKRIGVRLDRLIGDNLDSLWELLKDTIKFVRVVYVLCEEQAEKIPVTPEQFGRAMGGDSLEASCHAFIQALADFSQSRLRPAIRALTATNLEADRPTSFSDATNSPGSSASIPPG